MDQKPCQSRAWSSSLLPVFVASLAIVAAGCSDATAPARVALITTPTSSIALQQTPQYQVLNTSVTVTNTSAYPLAWSSCAVSLEKAGLPALPPGKSDWTSVWNRLCYILDVAAAISNPTVPPESLLAPGQSATISIVAPVGQQPYPEFDGQPGAYRFYVPLSIVVLGTYHQVPHDASVSQPFTLLPPAT